VWETTNSTLFGYIYIERERIELINYFICNDFSSWSCEVLNQTILGSCSLED